MAFFNSAVEVLQTLVVALGAGLGIWGVINLLEGYCPTITICCAAGSGIMPPRRRRKNGTRFSWKPCRNNPMWNICWMCCCSPTWGNGLP